MLKRLLAALFVVLTARSVAAQTWTWTGGGATNNWLDPKNWSPQSVPPDGADVNLFNGLPKVDVPVVIRRLKMSAGYLDGSGDVTVTERMDWTSGVLQGTGSLIIAPGASLFGSPSFNGITLTLSRRLSLDGFAALRAQRLLLSDGALEITSQGVLEVAGDAESAPALERERGYSGQITNRGTIRKVSPATVTVNAPLNCELGSRIEFLEGTLRLRQPGTFACKVNVPLNGLLFVEGSRTYVPGFEISGPGPVEIWGGTHEFPAQGLKNLGPCTIGGGAAVMIFEKWETDAPFTVLESSSFATSATATFRNLVCEGSLGGTGTIRITEEVSFKRVSVRAPLRVVIEADAKGVMQQGWIDGTLRVEGDLELRPPGVTLSTSNSGRLEIATGGTMTLITKPELGSYFAINYGTIENRGTIRKVGDSNFTTLGSDFENFGAIEIDTGTLNVNGLFTNEGTTRIGRDGVLMVFSSVESQWPASCTVEGTGLLGIGSARITYLGNFQHTGPIDISRGRLTIVKPPPLLPGLIRVLDNAELVLGDETVVADLIVNGGTVSLSGRVDFRKATFTKAALSGTGSGRFPPGAQVVVNQITGTTVSIINESAHTRVTELSAASIHNARGAAFGVVNPGPGLTGFVTPLLVNDGLMTANADFSIIGVLQNNGEVRVAAGRMSTSRVPANYSSGVLTGGTWIASGSGVFRFGDLTRPVLTTLGPGTIVRLDGPDSDFGGDDGLRPLARNEGLLEMTNRAKDLSPTGGTFVNAGDLRLHAGAVFSVLGNVTLDPAGSLTLDIGGDSLSSSGRVSASNTFSAAGRLVCGPVPPLSPTPSDVFQIVTCGQRAGEFGELFGMRNYGPRPIYLPTKVFVRLGTCPPDFNADSVVDDQDFTMFATVYDIADCADPLMPAGCPADFDSSGLVDDRDFSFFASRYDRVLCY